jgi:cystathionine gamma-synthase
MTCPSDPHPCTTAARYGVNSDPAHGAVMPPLYLSSNYSFDGLEGKRRYDYTRSGNPTRDMLGETLAQLEGGCGAVVTATGMAAVDLALFALEPHDLLIAPHDLYGGTHRLLCARAGRGHFRVQFVDQNDRAALDAAFALKPKLILIETPSNPLMRVVDVADVCARAHAVGCKAAVDNTFLSPALQQPIALGADLVIHSTTKYINGHSDVVGGCVVARDPADLERLTWWANCLGVTGSPFDAWLTLRGVRTLFARIERQQATAARVAEMTIRATEMATRMVADLDTDGDGLLTAAEMAARPGPARMFDHADAVDHDVGAHDVDRAGDGIEVAGVHPRQHAGLQRLGQLADRPGRPHGAAHHVARTAQGLQAGVAQHAGRAEH